MEFDPFTEITSSCTSIPTDDVKSHRWDLPVGWYMHPVPHWMMVSPSDELFLRSNVHPIPYWWCSVPVTSSSHAARCTLVPTGWHSVSVINSCCAAICILFSIGWHSVSVMSSVFTAVNYLFFFGWRSVPVLRSTSSATSILFPIGWQLVMQSQWRDLPVPHTHFNSHWHSVPVFQCSKVDVWLQWHYSYLVKSPAVHIWYIQCPAQLTINHLNCSYYGEFSQARTWSTSGSHQLATGSSAAQYWYCLWYIIINISRYY